MTTGNQTVNGDLTTPINNSSGIVTIIGNILNTTLTNNIGDVVIKTSVTGASSKLDVTCGNITIGSNYSSTNAVASVISQGILSIGGAGTSGSITLNGLSVFILPTLSLTTTVSISIINTIGANNLTLLQSSTQVYTSAITGFDFTVDSILVPNGTYTASYSGTLLTLTRTSPTAATYKFTNITGSSIPSSLLSLPSASVTYTYVTPTAASAVTLATAPLTPTTTTTTFSYFGAVPITPTCICFVRGTNILTNMGYISVEKLKKGDEAMVLINNECVPKPIKWIGKYTQIASGIYKPHVLPIRIKKSAIKDDLPMRDLLVSPGHALYLNDMLFQAQVLTNGISIYQDTSFDIVEYYHVKLEHHYIINAEGVFTESFFDVYNATRRIFDNSNEIEDIALEEKGNALEMIYSKCAAHLVLYDTKLIEPMKKRLAERANEFINEKIEI